MKILFMISTLENDGAERAMSNITMNLPSGVEADILLNSVSDHDFPTKAKVINLGMKPDAKKGYWYQFTALRKRIVTLRRLKRENQYDACISFLDSANICNIITGKKFCKTIVSVRNSIATAKTASYKFIVGPMIRMLYNRADCVVACSEGIRLELINQYGINENKIKVITNGYDFNHIRERMDSDRQEELERDKFAFVTMGRLSEQKGQWHLVRAFADLARKHANVVLYIIGKGKEESYLKELASQFELESKVIFLSYQKNPYTILASCDVFVMPSLWEGYCNALCEALICGLPCLATDFRTSAREILAPDTSAEKRLLEGIEYGQYGVLTPVCSGKRNSCDIPLEYEEQCLAKAMEEIYLDKDLRESYKQKTVIRGKEMDIGEKVKQWMQVVCCEE